MKRVLFALPLVALASAAAYLSPFYVWLAHDGQAPLPFWGWTSIPSEKAPQFARFVEPKFDDAGREILEVMQAHRASIGAPGMTAAVSVGGEIVWSGATGWSNVEDEEPMRPGIALRVGSTSKPMTATALAQMVQAGTIDLDAPITDYLLRDVPESWSAMTPRMLASHMAGLPHYGENTEWGGFYGSVALNKRYDDVRDAVEMFDEAELLSEPGTTFEYSTYGTVLLGAVMSDAAGVSYRELMEDLVFEPASIENTFVAPKLARGKDGLATFYVVRDGQYRTWRPVDLSHRLPGGGWAASSEDLVRIGSLWLDDAVISEETRDLFWTPQQLSSGETNEQDYAIGWRWREWEFDGLPVARNANHGGVSRGAQSWLIVYPDHDMVIAFNINSNTEEFSDFGSFYEDIYRAFVTVLEAAD